MSEIDDKALHDRVRQTLADYQPPYDPQDWQQLRRRIRRRRWQPLAILLGLLLMGTGGYLALTRHSPKSVVGAKQPIKAVADSPSPRQIPAVRPELPPVAVDQAQPNALPERKQKPNQLAYPLSSVRSEATATQAEWIMPLTPVASSNDRIYVLPAIRYQPPTPAELTLIGQVVAEDTDGDSTVLNALSRNLPRWRNAVIVCDLTTSMGPYAAQLYAWFRRSGRNPNVLGTVFYTDCDSLGHETRPGGLPGTFFVTRECDVRLAWPTILAAARNTVHNELDPENVVEALRYAQRTFPQADHLVLLTDNSSGVKDMQLLTKLAKPVHVIACGVAATETEPFGAGQYQIALKTGGSVHTLEDDLSQPGQVANNTFVRLGPHYYRYVAKKDKFVKTRRTHRPLRFLGINW